MNFKKTTLVTLAVLSIMGCSQNDKIENSDTLNLTQTDIDLMIQRAKAEERARITKELSRQEGQKKVFDEILISRGQEPRFSEFYQAPAKEAETGRVEAVTQAQSTQANTTETPAPIMTATNESPKADVNSLVRVLRVDANDSLATNRVMNAEGGISKIVPTSRKVTEYRVVNGNTYYTCAANSVMPVFDEQGQPIYQASNKELSATLCKKSRDKATMLELQKKLYKMGYLKSETLSYEQLVDGIWGDSTLEAVKQYQIDNGLLLGQMTIQTLEHIGVFANPQIIDSPKPSKTLLAQVKEPVVEKAAEVEAAKEVKELTDAKEKTSETQSAVTEPNKELKVDRVEQERKAKQEEQIALVIQKAFDDEKVILKIKPESRKPTFYTQVGGAKYYRCAANSYIPVKVNGGWDYSSKTEELSATLCKRSRDAATMTDLQYELHEQGYMPANGTPIGRLISGNWDQRTLAAVKRYQQANGLLYGQLTIETLEHLGIFKPAANRLVSATQLANHEMKTETPVKQPVSEVAEMKSEEVVSKTVDDASIYVTESNSATEQVSEQVSEEIPFVALKVRLADSSFDASNTVPTLAAPQVYAYVNKFKLMRCRARAVLPELTEAGEMVYVDNKEFRATLCKANRNIKLITRLQTALRDLGYLKPLPPIDRVVVDGIWGINTLTALKAYQKDNGLAYGQLTIESLEHLGVFVTD